MVRNYLYLFFMLFGAWLCLTSSFHAHELAAGAVVSLILSVFLTRGYEKLGLPPFGIKRAWLFLAYLMTLAVETVKANFDVAYRVLHPRMPIRPGIVAVRTNLKQDIAKLILANSITLTPGTFTVDIIGDTLLVHCIYVKDENIDAATEIIARKFEKYLEVIFG
ncbi:MAG: Na+/H+ antiporter subunit E [Chitinispirillaceae bacterium]|nr:Na+/H+ antiporter subunit E [Chitinispirillaceae bacterium]